MGRKSWRKLWQDKLRSSPKWTRLTPAAKGLWLEMFLLAKDDGRLMLYEGRPITVDDLAFEMRSRRDFVARWLSELEAVQLLSSDGGSYMVMTGLQQLCSGTTTGSLTDGLSDTKDLGPNKRSRAREEEKRREEKKKKTPPKPPTGVLREFDEDFWPNVPNKIGKGVARTAYVKARKKAGKEEILSGLPAFRAYEERRKKQKDYRPLHPSTWLNGERWSDETSPGDNGRPKRLTANVPPGHPCHGRKEGESWPKEEPMNGIRDGWWYVNEQGSWKKREKVLP